MLACLLLLSIAAPASARDCLEEVERRAQEYGVSTDPAEAEIEGSQPSLTPAPGETASEELAESGGVVEAPEQGEAIIIEPPEIGDPMETAPKVEPGPSEAPTTLERSAAERTQIQALLTAARAAAEEGRAEDCFERLQEARNIAGRPGQ